MPSHRNLFQNPSLFRIAHVRGEQAARADANKKEQEHTSRHRVESLSRLSAVLVYGINCLGPGNALWAATLQMVANRRKSRAD